MRYSFKNVVLYSVGIAFGISILAAGVAASEERTIGDTPEEVISSPAAAISAGIAEERHADVAQLWGKYVESTGDVSGERMYRAENPELLQALDSLIMSLLQGEGLIAVIPLLERTIEIQKDHGEAHREDLIGRLAFLADIFANVGYGDKAESAYLRLLSIQEDAVGTNHTEVATTLHDLAGLYSVQGRYADAEPLYQRSLAIRDQVLGAKHLFTVESLSALAYLYSAKDCHLDADTFYKRALTIIEESLGSDHPEANSIRISLAASYGRQGHYAEAIPLAELSLKNTKKIYGEHHIETALNLNFLASLYHDHNLYADAEPLFILALRIREELLGADHPETADVLCNLGMLYKDQVRYVESESYYQRGVNIYEQSVGRTHPKTISALNQLALVHFLHGSFVQAESIYLRLLSFYDNENGSDGPDSIACRNILGMLYLKQARYADAIAVAEYLLVIAKKRLPPDQHELMKRLSELAGIYYKAGRYLDAEPLLTRSLFIHENTFGSDHPETANILSGLGVLYSSLYRYADAEKLHNRALSARRQALEPDHPDIAASLINLGALYTEQGRYADSELFLKRGIAILEGSVNNLHSVTATALNNLADLYTNLGRYSDAEQIYLRSLAIKEEAFGADHSDTAISLNNLGILYTYQGRIQKAMSCLVDALEIQKNVFGSNHPETAMTMGNLALVHLHQGQYLDAERLFRLSVEILEQSFGMDSLAVASGLQNMAYLVQIHNRRYSEAEALYLRALQITTKNMGPNHPDVAGIMHNLAYLVQSQGRYEESASLFSNTIRLRKEVLGEYYPNLALTLVRLAHSRLLCNEYAGALSTACSAVTSNQRIMRREFQTLSERDRVLFLSTHDRGYLDVLLSLTLGRDSEVRADAANASALWVLRTKGLILSTLLEDRELLHNVPEAGPLTDRLRATKAQLSALSLQQSAGESAEQREARFRELAAQSEEQERELARLSAQQREGRPEPEEIGIKDVQQALAAGQILVEFYRFRPLSNAEQHKESGSLYLPDEYAAIIFRPDVEVPVVLSLGDAESLEVLVHKCQAVMRAGEPAAELLREIYSRAWAPLAEHIGAAGRVYISPDSELSFVPFAALLRPDGTYLCEHHEIGYVASGRDLLIRTRQGDAGAPALFGDPAFGEIQGAGDYLDRGAAFRSVLGTTDRAVLSGIRFPALPGTQREVQALKGALKASDQNPVAYLGLEATESRLKALQRPGLLHLATHGFFLPDIEQEPASRLGMLQSLDGSGPMAGPVRVENPMLRSGLALTGAALAAVEREGTNASDTEDGVVTAEEVSSLDLSSTRMVVLSACDTGVGEARAGQGVMGLRRAFAHAGARNLVMTLWPVQDEATVNLMVSFYDRYLDTDDAIGALSHLQRSSITQARESGEVPDPRVWGPFLISVQGREVSSEGKRDE